jgi:hypothetical protein
LAVTNSNSISTLFTINLRRLGTSIGKFSVPVISIAFETNPIAYATTAANMLVRFDPTKGTNTSVALTGLAASVL